MATIDAMNAAKNYGYAIGVLGSEAGVYGIDAAANFVNGDSIFTSGTYNTQPNTSSNSVDYDYTGTASTDTVDKQTATIESQIEQMITGFKDFLAQLMSKFQSDNANSTSNGSSKCETVIYNGKEVSKERMNEANDILKDKEMTETFDKLIEEFTAIKEKLNNGEKLYNEQGTSTEVSSIVDKILAMTDAEYIAFEKYYKEQTGGKLESAIKKLGLGEEWQGKMVEKAEAAQTWLTEPVKEAEAEAEAEAEKAEAKEKQMAVDAGKLLKAMKGLGTDEKAVREILAGSGYNAEELVKLMEIFEKLAGKSLREYIEGDFSGQAEKALVSILDNAVINAMYPTKEKATEEIGADAGKLYNAMKGLGTDEQAVYDVILGGNYTDEELIKLMDMFKEQFGKSLKDWIKGDFSGEAEKILLERIETAEKNVKEKAE